jgi:protein gp37
MANNVTRFQITKRSLATAKTIDEVGEICSWYDGIAKAARGIGDRDAEIEAAEFSIKAKRKLGQLILAASGAGALAKGGKAMQKPYRDKKNPVTPTLANAHVDKNLANSARKLGKLKPDEFDRGLAAWRKAINGDGERIKASLPEPPKEARTPSKRRADNISLKMWEEMDEAERRECLDPANYASDLPMNTQDGPGIEWAQKSWNPIVGCKHDCPYCYARDIATRYPDAFPHGFEPAFRPYMLNAPRNTSLPKEAMFDARYSHVFAGSMTDWFGRWVPREWIEAVLATMRENQLWKFLCLTKFPKRMAEFNLPPNLWAGTTVDLQARVANAEAAFAVLADKNPAGVRWLSIEPLLEPLKFTRLDLFKWVVIGGASKSSKTPAFHPPFPWIIDIYAQAKAAGCQVYMKTNLLGNRVLELPFEAPIKKDPSEAAEVFHYLGRATRTEA